MEKIKSTSFCILAWKGLTISPNGDAYPCCHTMIFQEKGLSNVACDNDVDFYNNRAFQEMRLQMLENKEIKICKKCNDDERKQTESLRNRANESHPDLVEDVKKHKRLTASVGDILYRDFRFSNICNLKCRTCNPESSSSWYLDAKLLKLNFNPEKSAVIRPETSKIIIEKILETDFSKTQEIYFAGGEPLLHIEHYLLLETLQLKNLNSIRLRYSSNLTVLEAHDRNILKIWPFFKNIDLMVSIDASIATTPLIRHSTKAKEVINNLKLIRLFVPQIKIKIATTISCLNVFQIFTLIEELINNNIISKVDELELSIVYNPDYYSLNTLTEIEFENLKSYLDKKNNVINSKYSLDFSPEIKKISRYPHKYNQNSRNKFYEITRQLDHIRNESSESIIMPNNGPNFFEFLCN